MKDAFEALGWIALLVLMAVGALLFVVLIYGGLIGTFLGVVYLFIKGVVGLFS